MSREEKLKELQTLYSQVDEDCKRRAYSIHGVGGQRFRHIVKGETQNPKSRVSDEAIEQGLLAMKQAIKDQISDKNKLLEQVKND